MKFLAFLILISMTSCSTTEKVDLILHHGTIFTLDSNLNQAEALAIRNGKIIATGSNQEILSSYESDSMHHLDGKFVYPGFYDAHAHFYGYGSNLLRRADLRETGSAEEVCNRLEDHRDANPSYWIEGRGWDQNDWNNQAFPEKHILDRIFPDNPVYLIRIDGHAAWVNSKALELAGITADTHVDGGEILLTDGEPNGILIDQAMDLVANHIPEPDQAFQRKALLLAQETCFQLGLTSVADAGLKKYLILLIDSMQQAGDLKIRLYAMLESNSENMDYFLPNGPYCTDRLSVRSIKLFADGALGSRGAKLLEPYSDEPNQTGLILHEPEFYKHYCQLALTHGYQVCTHAIGDSANRFVLELYAQFLDPGNDLRWRIEHAQIVHPKDFALFNTYKIIPSVQPTHATSDMPWAETRIGSERIRSAYAFQTLLQANQFIPLGTDFPIEEVNPLLTFYAAVARKDVQGNPPNGFQKEEALSRLDALKGMTIWAAKAAFEEDKKGSLEPNKWADLVVLDINLLSEPEAILPHGKVLRTYVQGELVFKEDVYQ